MAEYSERARYVTEQVQAYIANEGDPDPDTGERIAERAMALARANGLEALEQYVTRIIKTYPGRGARLTLNELAPNDWSRIRWDDVARELAVE